MRTRVTEKDLNAIVARINRSTKQSEEPYTKQKDGKFKTNIGNYHLDMAYGGIQLVQMVNAGGGIRVISNCGYVSKRELYQQLHAFISGLESHTLNN